MSQFEGTFQTKEQRLEAYLDMVKEISTQFKTLKVEHINREDNKLADALANLESPLETTSVKVVPLTYAEWPAIWKSTLLPNKQEQHRSIDQKLHNGERAPSMPK